MDDPMIKSHLGVAIATVAAARAGRIYGDQNIKRYLQQQKRDYCDGDHPSIAAGNRHGGPHLNLREIARNERRLARASAK